MGETSDKNGEHFFQEIKEMENGFHGRIIKKMLVDDCSFLQRESGTMYKRQAKRSKHFKRLTQQQLVCVFRVLLF